MRVERVVPVHDVVGLNAKRVSKPEPAETMSTSHGLTAGGRGGMRHARPIKSGSPPGIPTALDTRASTSTDSIGRPSPGDATRFRCPSASTPTGWNTLRCRTADPSCSGSVTMSDTRTRSSPRIVAW
jgi:hypothetical protein